MLETETVIIIQLVCYILWALQVKNWKKNGNKSNNTYR